MITTSAAEAIDGSR